MRVEEGDASGGGKLNMQDPVRVEAGGGPGGWGGVGRGGARARREGARGGLLEQVREYHVSSTIYLQSIYNLSTIYPTIYPTIYLTDLRKSVDVVD